MTKATSESVPASDDVELAGLTAVKTMLGYEFLVWLWYQSETSSPLRIGKYEIDLWVDDRLHFFDKAHENVMRGGDPSRSEEAAVALASGKILKELRLGLRINGTGDFIVTINAADLAPRAIVLPKTDNGEGPVSERLSRIALLIDCLDALFERFVTTRATHSSDAKSDSADEDEIRQWIAKRRTAVLH